MDEAGNWLRRYREAKHLVEKTEIAERIATSIAPKLHRYIRASCPARGVDDVLQEALVGIFRSLDKFRGSDQQFEHWCFRIAHNKLVNYLKSEKRYEAESIDTEEIWELIEASTETTPLSAADRERLAEAVALLSAAKEPCVKYLELRFVYGKKYPELARIFEKTARAVRAQVDRCIKLAQELVAKKGEAYA